MRADNWIKKSGIVGGLHIIGGFWRKNSGTISIRGPTTISNS